MEELVVSCCDASELLKFGEHTLDEIALFVEGLIVVMRASSLGARWDDGDGPGLEDCIVEVLGVVGSVSDDVGRFQAGEQLSPVDDVAPLSWRQDQSDWKAQSIGYGMDLGAEAASGPAKALGLSAPLLIAAPEA